MKNLYAIGIVLGLLILNPFQSQAQCKSFTKKNCLSQLEGYTGNGQYNGAVLFEGEEATLVQTFYSGKDYRLYVCAHPTIKDSVFFEVSDYRKNDIFTSKDKEESFFDFSVESTQQLNIRVVVPELGTNNELKKNGCVSILVGFKSN